MVSIRCLVYNHEPFLRQCLDGFVMQQVNFSYEAIVHDDASTDGSAEIIKEYAEKYPDIIKPILETENQYSKRDGSLRRIMNAHTRGKYVALCEGDDYWTDPLKLQKQVDFLESHPDYSMCCHAANVKSESSQFIRTACDDADIDLSLRSVFSEGGEYIATATIVFRKSILVGFDEFSTGCPVGDYPLQMWCAMNGKVRHMFSVMSVYRVGYEGSWSMSNVKKDNHMRVFNGMVSWLDKTRRKATRKYKKFFLMAKGRLVLQSAYFLNDYYIMRWNFSVLYYLLTTRRLRIALSCILRAYGALLFGYKPIQ